MHSNSTSSEQPVDVDHRSPGTHRDSLRAAAVTSAMRKRAQGIPTYTVPEAAVLLSISQEYLYRLIQADAFPAVRMRLGRNQGRYVVPAKVVERLLEDAAEASSSLDVGEWTERAAPIAGGLA